MDNAYAVFKKTMVIPVINRAGKVIEARTFTNPPISFLWPKEVICLIDWKKDSKGLPTIEEMFEPVALAEDVHTGPPNNYTFSIPKGTKFWGYFAWGSGAKSGVTIGMQRDITRQWIGVGPLDGQRMNRSILSNAMYGGVELKDVKALVLGKDELVPGLGYPMADGFDYVDSKLVEVAREGAHVDRRGNKIEPQEPEDAQDNYSRDQRVRLRKKTLDEYGNTVWVSTGVWEENRPYLQAEIDRVRENRVKPDNVQYLSKAHQKDKERLAQLDPKMMSHPFIAFSMQRGRANEAARLASSFPMKSKVRLMVPTTAPIAALPAGKWVINGMPQTSYASSKAVKIARDRITRAEVRRIAKMAVVQTSISTRQLATKGQAGVIEGLFEKTGYHIILCNENIKMASSALGGKDLAKEKHELVLTDGVMVMLAYTAPGHSVGINPKLAENMSRDFDGDYAYLIDCSARPAYWAEVNEYPVQKSPKLPKIQGVFEKKLIDDRPRLILETMRDVIGFATNLMSGTFTMADHDQLAADMGYKATSGMDDQVTFFCRVGEDLFKVDLSQLKDAHGKPMSVEKLLVIMGEFQNNLVDRLGRMPTYCGWKRSPDAFKTMIPEVWSHALDGLDKKDPRMATSINPMWDGTVATIAKYALPQLVSILSEPIEHSPLMEFQPWAEEQAPEVMEAVAEFQNSFNQRIVSLNWGDRRSNGSVATFMAWLGTSVEGMLKRTGATAWVMANALWFEAHGSRSANAGAASVFLAFPNEAERIIVEKPGMKSGVTRSILMGLAPGVVNVRATGVIRSFKGTGGVVVRGFVPDSKKLLKEGNAFAGIPPLAPQLAEGRVLVYITFKAARSWGVEVLQRM